MNHAQSNDCRSSVFLEKVYVASSSIVLSHTVKSCDFMHARTIFYIGIFSHLYNWISCIHSRRDQKDLLVKLSDLTAADVRSGSETSQHACRNPRSICTSEPDVIENSAFFMHCALISICVRLARMRSRSNLAAVRRRRQARARPLCRGVIGVLLLHDRPAAGHRHREALPTSIFARTCAPGRPHLSPSS